MRAYLGKTCAARVVGRYAVVVHGADPPSEEEWAQLVDIQTSAPNEGAVRVLVWTDGGAPNAAQRSVLTARASGTRMISAILTPSVLARAAAIAIRLLQPDMRILAPHDVERALDHLEVPERERTHLKGAINEMRGELQRPR
jgi:hypothetical protein